jgi:hypothetical protein
LPNLLGPNMVLLGVHFLKIDLFRSYESSCKSCRVIEFIGNLMFNCALRMEAIYTDDPNLLRVSSRHEFLCIIIMLGI